MQQISSCSKNYPFAAWIRRQVLFRYARKRLAPIRVFTIDIDNYEAHLNGMHACMATVRERVECFDLHAGCFVNDSNKTSQLILGHSTRFKTMESWLIAQSSAGQQRSSHWRDLVHNFELTTSTKSHSHRRNYRIITEQRLTAVSLTIAYQYVKLLNYVI